MALLVRVLLFSLLVMCCAFVFADSAKEEASDDRKTSPGPAYTRVKRDATTAAADDKPWKLLGIGLLAWGLIIAGILILCAVLAAVYWFFIRK